MRRDEARDVRIDENRRIEKRSDELQEKDELRQGEGRQIDQAK